MPGASDAMGGERARALRSRRGHRQDVPAQGDPDAPQLEGRDEGVDGQLLGRGWRCRGAGEKVGAAFAVPANFQRSF